MGGRDVRARAVVAYKRAGVSVDVWTIIGGRLCQLAAGAVARKEGLWKTLGGARVRRDLPNSVECNIDEFRISFQRINDIGR